MGLVKLPAAPDPRVAGWLDDTNSTPLRRRLVERSAMDDGLVEVPPGSNRGTRLDRYADRAGSPRGSYWCAIMAGIWFIDCGLLVPAGFGSVDAWLPYMVKSRAPGSLVIYGPHPRNGEHIGLLTRVGPIVLTREGNRGLAGSNTNNGIICDQAAMTRQDVLGYVPPEKFISTRGRGRGRLILADE